jgi:hypothetical protein
MSAKRLLLICFAPLLLLAIMMIRLAMAPGIEWQDFEQRISTIFETSGMKVLSVATEEPESIPLPFGQKVRSLLSWRRSGPLVATGFPESVSHWIVRRTGGPMLECLVRYHEGKAVCVVIRSTDSAEKEKRALRDEVAKAFPYLKITLEDICPPHGSGAAF